MPDIPSPGALRAADRIIGHVPDLRSKRELLANWIDAETGAAELIAALERLCSCAEAVKARSLVPASMGMGTVAEAARIILAKVRETT